MAWMKLTVIALQGSIFVIVFVLGLDATWRDAISLFGRPAMLIRSLLSMNVIIPLLAAALAALFDLRPAVEIALVLLAVSPVPPTLPRQQLKVAGKSSYVVGLLTAMSIISIVVVPVTIEVLGKTFSQEVHIHPIAVAKVVFKTVLLPLAVGICVRSRWPNFAGRLSAPLSTVANGLLFAALISLLLLARKPIVALVGNGTIFAMVVFVIAAVAVGHWFGRPDPAEQTTLALATASRHPGLAMAIATANFPEQKPLIAAAILLYLLVSKVSLIPYIRWSRLRLKSTSPNQPEVGTQPRGTETPNEEERREIA